MEYEELSLTDKLKNDLDQVSSNAFHILSNISSLGDAHIELLNEEVKEQKQFITKGASFLIAGVISGVISLLLITVTLFYIMIEYVDIPFSLSLGILATLWIIITTIFLRISFLSIKDIYLVPNQSIRSIKETLKCLYN